MTFSTTIYICEPVNPASVFDFGLTLLAPGQSPAVAHEPAGDRRIFPEGHYMTEPSQGLGAWFMVHYAGDGPLVHLYPDEIEGDEPWWNRHLIRVRFESGFGYEAQNGADCCDLHAWLVQEFLTWLDAKGITRVVWQPEYDESCYGPTDPVTILGDPRRGQLLTQGDSHAQRTPHHA